MTKKKKVKVYVNNNDGTYTHLGKVVNRLDSDTLRKVHLPTVKKLTVIKNKEQEG